MRTVVELVPDGTPGVKVKLQRLRQLIDRGRMDPKVRSLALRLIEKVPERAWSREIDALHGYVRRAVRYTMDPAGVELFVEPGRMLGEMMGDCDDHVALLGSLLEATGHPVRLKVGGPGGGRWSHVWLEVFDRGRGAWRSADPIAKSRGLGYDPGPLFDATLTMTPPTTYGGAAGVDLALGRLVGAATRRISRAPRRAAPQWRSYRPADVTRSGPGSSPDLFRHLLAVNRRRRPGADRLVASGRPWKPRQLFRAPQKALPSAAPLGPKVAFDLATKPARWDLADFYDDPTPFVGVDGITLDGWKKIRKRLKKAVKKVGKVYAKVGKRLVKFGKKALPYAAQLAPFIPGVGIVAATALQFANRARQAYLARKRAGIPSGGLPPEAYEVIQQLPPGIVPPGAAQTVQRIQQMVEQWGNDGPSSPSFQTPGILPSGTTWPGGGGGGGFDYPPEPQQPASGSTWSPTGIMAAVAAGMVLVLMMSRRR